MNERNPKSLVFNIINAVQQVDAESDLLLFFLPGSRDFCKNVLQEQKLFLNDLDI